MRATSGANEAGSPPQTLGSPIQLRTEKPLPEKRRSAETVRAPQSPPAAHQQRVISSESAVPTRPVKLLTERQLEKLSATKGIVAPSATGASAAASRKRHEQQYQSQHPQQPIPIERTPPPQSAPLPTQQENGSSSAGGVRIGNMDATTPRKKRSKETPDPFLVSSEEVPHSPPLSPRSLRAPDEYAQARTRRRGKALEKSRPEGIKSVEPAADPTPEPDPAQDSTVNASHPAEHAPDPALEEEKEATFYPLAQHLTHPALLGHLLDYLAFNDWLALSNVSKDVRERLREERDLSERVLERFLRTVGYKRWAWGVGEEVVLTLTDLNAYMHGVSLPPHQFARYADAYLQTANRERDRTQRALIQSLQAACRSYTRVVLRLRAQAEAEALAASASGVAPPTSPQRGRGLPSIKSTTSVNNVLIAKKSFSRSSSRAPSPTSSYSHSHSYSNTHARSASAAVSIGGGGSNGGAFNSPLFRLRRAPLLQVFVPSPEGDWLSDASVLECERELERAGVLPLLRPGDVVWDTAVGDEGNVGRMVWDGSYLIDLDYTYSRVGDLPKYLPTLAFPPSYFHRVVRTMGNGNPICHIDIAPWSEEIAANLQLLQDRTKTETPQGGHHMVVRWVHRSSFTIRPPPAGKPLRVAVPRDVGPGPGPGGAWFIDPGWYGTVVVEAEGTNEGLADLQARCRGAFPPRVAGAATTAGMSPDRAEREEAQKCVFRILREKSRPGEIWIKTVTDKERLLPP
ncbi:hypothetical protein BN946_scf184912.g57 [Trametes cinnabarina]|uniref:F-box domain-containing protein n=1 Tax=Pycnoporus cinnabarinus TaxID=5643 RepID=A0A060SYC5_PYCCI|nr:hypothetical protein BN946_scf184912.g57 [Trametes cinnabarina]